VSWTPTVTQTTPTQAGVTFTHSYDGNNRRVGQTASDNSWLLYPATTGTTSYTANNLNQYTAVGGASPTYDSNGSRIDPAAVATSQPSGLYYLRARAYSPQWGRFIQVDPIGYAGGINLYAYTGNDPLNETDPMGLQACAAVGSGPGSTCLESNNSVYSNINIGPVQGENQGVLQNIHSIDTANPPESSYAVHNDPSSGNGFSLVKVGGAETNTSNTTGLRLTPSDYIGSVGEAHPHPYNDYSPDVGPEDPVASYKLGVPVYTSAPGTVTVTGMVNGQFYTQYLQGRAQERSDVRRILNRAQSLVNSGTISAGGPGVSASYGPGK